MNLGTTQLTRKGQLTVPVAIRQLLNLQKGDKVDFVMMNGQVVLKQRESVVARTAGIAKSTRSFTNKQLREEVEKAIADEASKRGL
jgi:AbrB family looped-hinge helix DNA binding protein